MDFARLYASIRQGFRMARRSIRNSVFIAGLSLAAAALVAGTALARTIRVDSGPLGYPDRGEAWLDGGTAIQGAESIDGSLPFGSKGINFGLGYTNVTGFCLSENGFVAFYPCGAIDPNTVLSPLARDWTSDPDTDRTHAEPVGAPA